MVLNNELGPGRVFVIHADITKLSVDAIVVPTSVKMRGYGAIVQKARSWPRYDAHYSTEQERSHAMLDTSWCPLERESRLPRGVVTVCVTGDGLLDADDVADAAKNGTRLAVAHAARKLDSDTPTLVAVPLFLTGRGGHGVRAAKVVRAQLEGARAAIDEAARMGQHVDVVLVAYTPQLARICRGVRRAVGEAPTGHMIPPKLSAALQSRACALVVGAGLSRAAGFPDWNGLLALMGAPEDASPVERAAMVPRKERTRVLGKVFADDADPRQPTLAHYFVGAIAGRLLLTTNYDRLAERALSAQRRPYQAVIHAEHAKSVASPWLTSVVKVHGDASDIEKVVFDSHDYEAWETRHASIALILEEALMTHTLLFIGYGLGDPDFKNISARVAKRLSTVQQDAFAVLFDGEDKAAAISDHIGHNITVVRVPLGGKGGSAASMLRFLDELSEAVLREPLHLLGRDEEEVVVPDAFRPLGRMLLEAADAAAAVGADDGRRGTCPGLDR